MAESVTRAELQAWCDQQIALLETNIAEARRNQWRQVRADYERELARWQAMREMLTKNRIAADSGTT